MSSRDVASTIEGLFLDTYQLAARCDCDQQARGHRSVAHLRATGAPALGPIWREVRGPSHPQASRGIRDEFYLPGTAPCRFGLRPDDLQGHEFQCDKPSPNSLAGDKLD